MQTVRILTWNNRNTQFIKTITAICSVSNVTSPAPLWHHVILLMSTAVPLATFNLERFKILNVRIDTRTQNETLKMYNTSIFQTVLFEPKEIVYTLETPPNIIHSAPSWQLCWLDTYDKYNIYQYIYILLLLYIDIYIYIYIHIFPHINSSPAEKMPLFYHNLEKVPCFLLNLCSCWIF